MSKKKVIFLDRDGTINVDRHDYVHRTKDWVWTRGAVEGMKKLREADYLLVLVTNQSGIGQGLYTREDMEEVHRRMISELAEEEIGFAAIMHCPHPRDGGCGCRKPATGMIDRAVQRIGSVDFGSSWVIGDKITDVRLGKNVGANTALIWSRFWRPGEPEEQPDIIVGSLYEAAERIVTGNR